LPALCVFVNFAHTSYDNVFYLFVHLKLTGRVHLKHTLFTAQPTGAVKKMATQPKTRKLTTAEKKTAEQLLLVIVGNHSDSILNARDGEVDRNVVTAAVNISVAFHAHGIEGEQA
jgi:hypothetical protein